MLIAISKADSELDHGIWVPWSLSKGNEVPNHAVEAGYDGGPLYVMRARHNGKWIPGKFNPTWNTAYVSHNGKDPHKSEFEVSLIFKESSELLNFFRLGSYSYKLFMELWKSWKFNKNWITFRNLSFCS